MYNNKRKLTIVGKSGELIPLVKRENKNITREGKTKSLPKIWIEGKGLVDIKPSV